MNTSLVSPIERRPAVDMPVPRSQPDYLAAAARLRGLEPADVSRARVLELGCRSGRNLIPLAERYPQASFLGIDNSADRVAAATSAAREQGLTNIEFRRRELAALELADQQFDYVIAEGFYSSLDDAARDQLLATYRELLAPQGVGYIGYKTYPGHHIPDILGAMLRFESRGAEDVPAQIARGRAMIRFLQNSLREENPYTALLRGELAPVAEQDDGELTRNYLVAGTRPVYLRQLLEQISRHGLKFLGDGAVSVRYTDELGTVTEERLARLSDDPLKREQYRDVVRNRRFRQTLLCRAELELDTTLSAARFAGLYLEGRIVPEDPDMKFASSRTERFLASNGVVATTSAPLVKAALVHLGEIWPDFITLDDLLAAACARVESLGVQVDPDHDLARLADNLVQCCGDGLMAVHASPPSFTPRVSARPVASPWARWQARRGETPTNRRHQAVHLETIDAHALAVLDGSRGPEELLEALVDSATGGQLSVLEGGERIQDAERARPLLAAALMESLARLAQQGLLIG